MKNSFNFKLVNLIILLSLTTLTNGIEESNQAKEKWTDRNILFTTGSVIGLACILSLVMIYTALQYRRRSLIAKQNENQDEEKAVAGKLENSLDDLFKSTANDEDKFKENNGKRKSFPNSEEEKRATKVHGFLLRAMTLPQSVIQTVGRLQTIQITEPSSPNVQQQSTNKQQSTNQVNSQANSPSGNSNLTSTPTLERPVNFNKKPTAVKSPSERYLKKSPSPTGQKSPPQQQATASSDLNETVSSTVKNDELASKQDIVGSNSELKLESDDSLGEFKLGKIQFCLKYNYEKHAITVSMIKCMNLPGKNTMNTYVKIQLLPDKKHKVKTRTIRKNQNPHYQEEFTFFNIQPSQLDNLALHFMIMSFDRYSRDEILGEVLQPCSDQFDTLEKQVSLTLDISPKGLLSKSQGRGELLVSLCYNTSACILSLVVLKAKNLPKVVTGLPDPYVKINLMVNNKRISKKKTHNKKKTLNPIYNEIFSFDLSNEITNSTDDSVDFKIWENIKLELIVIDYDRIARNENIGCLTLCINSTDAEVRKHMKEMLNQPRKQIACWHKLQGME